MLTTLSIIHAFICILFIILVLLQFGKGAELGATLSASQSIFTSSQKGNFLTRFTIALAILFLVNSVALSVLSSKNASRSSLDEGDMATAAPLTSSSTQNKTPVETKAQEPVKEQSTDKK